MANSSSRRRPHGACCRTATILPTGASASVKDYPQSVMGKLAVRPGG
jgi:hypothetical protein